MSLNLINWSSFLAEAWRRRKAISPPEIRDNQQPPLAGIAQGQ